VTVTIGVTRTLTGTLNGGVIVAPGTSVALIGAHLTGSVMVQPGGALDVEDTTIVGSVTASGPTGVRICGAIVAGSVTVTGATGFVQIGDSGDDACAPNTIGGTLSLLDNTAGLEAIGN
jgi:hypothetical protein